MKKCRIVLIALLLAVIIPFSALAAPTVHRDHPLSFSTSTLYGKPINSSIIKKYDLVMINFWANWCYPCTMELPDLQQIHKNYKNVLLLGVCVNSETSAAVKAAEKAGITYPLFHMESSFYQYLQIQGSGFSIPQTCFFNSEGYQLNSAYVGSRDYETWASIVDELLAFTAKPSIKTQPKSASVKAGKKVTFKVKALGKNLKYQWYYRTSSAGTWKKVSSGGRSATLSFKVKSKQNGYQYRCLVKNSAGKVYSKAATLKVKK